MRGFTLNQNLQNGAEDGDEDAHLPNGDFLEGFDFGFIDLAGFLFFALLPVLTQVLQQLGQNQ